MIRNIKTLPGCRKISKHLNARQRDILCARIVPSSFFCNKAGAGRGHGAVLQFAGESQELERFKQKMPLKNVPFIKELFVGRFHPVKETIYY